MIKSVTFKNPNTQSLDLAGMRVTRDALTPELYLKLAGIDPKLTENFEVEFTKAPKTIKPNGEADERGADSASS